MRHLGSRVSALLDGQLSPAEEEAAWSHVQTCHPCRDMVEREGWIKTQLLSLGSTNAPDRLKGTLGDPSLCAPRMQTGGAHRTRSALVAIGGGALGAAALGVFALTAAPGTSQERPPTTQVSRPSPSQSSSGSSTGTREVSWSPWLDTRQVRLGGMRDRLAP